MSETPRPFDKSDGARKRRFTSGEDRIPTPYPTLEPMHPRISNRFLEPAKPDPTKKDTVDIGQTQSNIPPASKDNCVTNAIIETPTAAKSSVPLPSYDPTVEDLKDEINGLFNGLLKRIVSNIENLRANILQEITVTFGNANLMEKFEDEIQSKTEEDDGLVVGGLDGHGGKTTESKLKNDEGDASGDKTESSDEKNSNPLPVDYDLSFEA